MDSLVTTVALVAAFTCFFCEGVPAPYIIPIKSVLPIFAVSRFSSSESDELLEVQDPPTGNATTHDNFVLGPFNFSAFNVKLDGPHKVKRLVPTTSYDRDMIQSIQNCTDAELEPSTTSTLTPLS